MLTFFIVHSIESHKRRVARAGSISGIVYQIERIKSSIYMMQFNRLSKSAIFSMEILPGQDAILFMTHRCEHAGVAQCCFLATQMQV
jgi:hypothetical protein